VDADGQVSQNGTRRPFGLCLSGGGFRAALYGLGVMRYLAEARRLSDVSVICGVSGGAVATAAVGSGVAKAAGRDGLDQGGFITQTFDPFLQAVTSRNLRQEALRRWLHQRILPGGRPRNLILAEVLHEALFPHLTTLVELPDHPQLIFTGTELGAGRAFRFAKSFIGSWDQGYTTPPQAFAVAEAVAASAAAPPFIPPLQLHSSDLGLANAPHVLTITDGGVYDNLGIEWFQGWSTTRRPRSALPADDLIVVNASGPLARAHGPFRGLRALNRSRKVQYAQTQATRIRWLVAELEAGRQQGIYLGVTGDPRKYRLPDGAPVDPSCYSGALPSQLVTPLAELRTDFNRFTADEARLLSYHGYWSAHARLASLRPAQAVECPSWREYEQMPLREADQLTKDLCRTRRHVGIADQAR
jgi:NTE family protein